MEIIQGKGVSDGIAIGTLRFMAAKERVVSRRDIPDTAAECERFEEARQRGCEQVDALHRRALAEVGEKDAAVFEIHRMMLDDEDYLDAIRAVIVNEKANAEYAVQAAREEFSAMFLEMDDPYMQERSADVHDISNRLLDCLAGRDEGATAGGEPMVIGADDLSPSETIGLDRSAVLAFVTGRGARNSHTAILARTMGLPAVVGVGDAIGSRLDGLEVVVDGFSGAVYVEPDEKTLTEMRGLQRREAERRTLLEGLKGKPNRTLDGKDILVYANIGSVEELDLVAANDAGGIGLFRTEFLFLEQDSCPDEETQFAAYRKVAAAMGDKRSIFRTLDIGADKQVGFLDLGREENPALGLRGLRLCLERPDIFSTQVRALVRASAFGKVAIMFPMVCSPWEVAESKKVVRNVQDELRQNSIAFDPDMEIGIMVETPAAAVISDRLAREVDFISIGTNDLTQYTLAVDRQESKLERYCDDHHEAVLRLIGMVAENAHQNGIWVGVCGELAGDMSVTETLLRLGVDELSVSPGKVLDLRQTIADCRIS